MNRGSRVARIDCAAPACERERRATSQMLTERFLQRLVDHTRLSHRYLLVWAGQHVSREWVDRLHFFSVFKTSDRLARDVYFTPATENAQRFGSERARIPSTSRCCRLRIRVGAALLRPLALGS